MPRLDLLSQIWLRKCLGILALFCLLFLHPSIWAQKTKGFEENAKIAVHDDLPTACTGYWWYNQLRWDSLWNETYVYSAGGLLMETIHDAVISNQGFQPHSRYIYEYDTAGRETSHIQQTWSSGTYIHSQRRMRYYDQHGLDSLDFQFYWAPAQIGMDWDTLSGGRTLRTWLPGGLLGSEEFEVWTTTTSGSFWAPQSKTLYHYSPAMEWDTVTYFQSLNGNWSPNGRKVSIHWHSAALNQMASFVTQLPNGGWSDVQRTTCHFNGLDSDCYNESFSGIWDSVSRQMQFYDPLGHLIHYEQRLRQGNQWTVVDGRFYDFTYDSLGHTTQIIQREWNQQNSYVNTLKLVYADWFVGIGNPESPSLQMTTFPNPAAEYCNFNLPGTTKGPVLIQLVDLQGRPRLLHVNNSYSTNIRLDIPTTLENGVYLYQVTIGSKAAKGKIEIMR